MEIHEAVRDLTLRLKTVDKHFGTAKAVTERGVSSITVQPRELDRVDALRPVIKAFSKETGIKVEFIAPNKQHVLKH